MTRSDLWRFLLDMRWDLAGLTGLWAFLKTVDHFEERARPLPPQICPLCRCDPLRTAHNTDCTEDPP